MTWESDQQTFKLTNVRRVVDLSEPRARTEQTRTPDFLYFQGPQAQKQVFGFDRDVAYAVAPNGNASRASAAVARDRRMEFYHHPLTIARAMLDPSTTIGNLRSETGGRAADVRIGETTFTVSLDSSGRPVSVRSPGYHPNMGDVVIETRFADYDDVDGLVLPSRLTTHTDGRTTTQLQIDRYLVNAAAGELAAPSAIANAAAPNPPAPVVEVTQVGKSVWLLAGQSHHSALVEFADHLTLIEAPQNEARTLAVIGRARELVPGKPLTELVMSHHHFDHSGGLRAAVSEGLTVITHTANAAFVNEMVKRPHNRQPDALQRNPRALNVRTVDDTTTLADSTMTMVLYPVSGNPHGDTMLMAYVPGERLLIEVDAYSPGGTYHPYAAHLLETTRARQLRVDRIVPLHGSPVSFDDLVKAVEAQEGGRSK
jgi:glyoxylase-like metal-dependent hydrolase (beta-lactamase superfamily II)